MIVPDDFDSVLLEGLRRVLRVCCKWVIWKFIGSVSFKTIIHLSNQLECLRILRKRLEIRSSSTSAA